MLETTKKRRARQRWHTVIHASEARRRRRIMRQAAHLDIKVPGKEDDHDAIHAAIREFCKRNKRVTAV